MFILGDNLLYGDGLPKLLEESIKYVNIKIQVIFSYTVSNPSNYGIARKKTKLFH